MSETRINKIIIHLILPGLTVQKGIIKSNRISNTKTKVFEFEETIAPFDSDKFFIFNFSCPKKILNTTLKTIEKKISRPLACIS